MRPASLAWAAPLLLPLACRQPNPAWQGAAEGDGSTMTTTSGPVGMDTGPAPTTSGATVASAETTDPTDPTTSTDTGTTTSTQTSTDPSATTTTGSPDGQRLFVSSQSFTGDLGGLNGADSTCEQLASAAGLGGSWTAVLSDDSQDARDRVVLAPPVVNIAGETVVDDADSLWEGMLLAPILYDEYGMATQGLAWTGSTGSGVASALDCGAFGGTSGMGAAGDPAATDAAWLQQGANGCGTMARIYCIESP